MARGVSYRPQILMASLQMIAEHPWRGLGLGGDYKVFADGMYFDHAHNLFTHVAIELGLPGLLLWCAAWLAILYERPGKPGKRSMVKASSAYGYFHPWPCNSTRPA